MSVLLAVCFLGYSVSSSPLLSSIHSCIFMLGLLFWKELVFCNFEEEFLVFYLGVCAGWTPVQ